MTIALTRNKKNHRLKREGLDYFRATEYYSLQRQFAKYRDPINYPKPLGSHAAKTFRDDLENIIRQSKVIGMALVIPLDTYWRIRDSSDAARQIFPSDPFEVAIQSLIDQCVKDSIRKMGGTGLEFYCDEGPNSRRIFAVYEAYKSLNPNANAIIKSLKHLDDKKFPQLQAADLMAHLGREVYMTKAKEPKTLRDSVEWIKVWNEQYMRELLEHETKRRDL